MIQDFLSATVANGIRAAFDQHFATPHSQLPAHQIWNYWHVPRIYTYLRTDPQRLVPPSLVTALTTAVRAWASATLGFDELSGTFLSLYINGCRQGLHNDSENGRYGWVYSITRWDERRFTGGETILMRDLDYLESGRAARAGAGLSFYDLVSPEFNQLLVFDDRMIHGVEPIQGDMDPLEGRVVLHGHIRAGQVLVDGALGRDVVLVALEPTRAAADAVLARVRGAELGVVSLRLTIAPSGRLGDAVVLSEQLAHPRRDTDHVRRLLAELIEIVSAVHFPAASSPTRVTLPLRFG